MYCVGCPFGAISAQAQCTSAHLRKALAQTMHPYSTLRYLKAAATGANLCAVRIPQGLSQERLGGATIAGIALPATRSGSTKGVEWMGNTKPGPAPAPAAALPLPVNRALLEPGKLGLLSSALTMGTAIADYQRYEKSVDVDTECWLVSWCQCLLNCDGSHRAQIPLHWGIMYYM